MTEIIRSCSMCDKKSHQDNLIVCVICSGCLKNSNWISVKDRLPEINGSVLTASYSSDKDKYLIELVLFDDGYFYSIYDAEEMTNDSHWEITHWMPLPEPPIKFDEI